MVTYSQPISTSSVPCDPCQPWRQFCGGR